MGINQSTTLPSTARTVPTTTTTKETTEDRKGIHLAEYNCRRTKKIYNQCYAIAYQRFIDAQAAQAGHECSDEFDTYRTCVLRGMKKQLLQQGTLTIHPESMLGELDDEDNRN